MFCGTFLERNYYLIGGEANASVGLSLSLTVCWQEGNESFLFGNPNFPVQNKDNLTTKQHILHGQVGFSLAVLKGSFGLPSSWYELTRSC